jgi:hypothetical protein
MKKIKNTKRTKSTKSPYQEGFITKEIPADILEAIRNAKWGVGVDKVTNKE